MRCCSERYSEGGYRACIYYGVCLLKVTVRVNVATTFGAMVRVGAGFLVAVRFKGGGRVG